MRLGFLTTFLVVDRVGLRNLGATAPCRRSRNATGAAKHRVLNSGPPRRKNDIPMDECFPNADYLVNAWSSVGIRVPTPLDEFPHLLCKSKSLSTLRLARPLSIQNTLNDQPGRGAELPAEQLRRKHSKTEHISRFGSYERSGAGGVWWTENLGSEPLRGPCKSQGREEREFWVPTDGTQAVVRDLSISRSGYQYVFLNKFRQHEIGPGRYPTHSF